MDSSIIKQDGSLYSRSSHYVSWNIGDEEIVLDGRFTVEDLVFLLSHIDKEPPRVDETGRVTNEYIHWCMRHHVDPFPNWGNDGNGRG